MTVEGVDLTTIGLFSLVTLPISLKFVWAPVLDRYVPPFLGRRRGWLLVTQVALLLAIAAMALHDPQDRPAACSPSTPCSSPSSAPRRTSSATPTVPTSWRSGRWAPARRSGCSATASRCSSPARSPSSSPTTSPGRPPTLVMSLLMLVGVATVFWAPEPILEDRPPRVPLRGRLAALPRLLPALGRLDGRAGPPLHRPLQAAGQPRDRACPPPSCCRSASRRPTSATVVGVVGLVATIVGSLVGGGAGRAGWRLNRSLWVALLLQALSQIGYLALALHGHDYGFMVAAVVAENFVYGMVDLGVHRLPDEPVQQALLRHAVRAALQPDGGEPRPLHRPRRRGSPRSRAGRASSPSRCSRASRAPAAARAGAVARRRIRGAPPTHSGEVKE